jgi:hypothetical protein
MRGTTEGLEADKKESDEAKPTANHRAPPLRVSLITQITDDIHPLADGIVNWKEDMHVR